MSFRSPRSTTIPVAPPRRRSSSLNRSSATSNGYQSANSRPFSVHGGLQYPSTPSSTYNYGSNGNLSRDYYGSDYRRNSYGTSAYSSPYKDRYTQNYGSNGSYVSAYKDRSYFNPYASSSYDNGVTTASLSFPTKASREATPMRSSNLLSVSSSGLGGSNSSLLGNGQSITNKIANIGRSQSLREHERKNRSRKCKEAAKAAVPDTSVPYEAAGMSGSLSSANKSLSSLSLQSEGYEVIPCCIST